MRPPPTTSNGTSIFPAGPGPSMTLDALMARQKEIAQERSDIQPGNIVSPTQGFAYLGNILANKINQRRADKQLAEANQGFADLVTNFDPVNGPSQAQIATAMQYDRDFAMQLLKDRADRMNQERYGPPITGEAAKALGLDPTKSYQLNQSTGQYDAIGGGGTNVTVGTGEKLTESLIKDTTYYPGALSANLELEDIDEQLTSVPNSAAMLLPGSSYWSSDDYRRALTAGDAWIMNVLRRESGASIGEKELNDNRRVYLPAPGDDLETIAYKRRLREEKTASLRYGLEAAAPETLAKIDAAHERQKAAAKERRAKKAGAGGAGGAGAGAGGGGGAVVAEQPKKDANGILQFPESWTAEDIEAWAAEQKKVRQVTP